MAFRFLSRPGSGRHPRRPDVSPPRRRRFVAELTTLERKELLSFVVQATAEPNILYPPTGKYIPVVVTGKAYEYEVDTSVTPAKVTFADLPGPKIVRYRVIDEYHREEPQGNITLTGGSGGTFDFTFTVYLQASRSDKAIAGRRYYIDVAAGDSGKSFSSVYVPVQVPHSLTDRGPGPKLPPTTTTTTTTKATTKTTASAASTTKKAATTHPATTTTTVTTKQVASTSTSSGSSFSSFFKGLV